MELPAVLVLVSLALLVGAAFGAWCVWPAPRPLPPPELPSPAPVPLAPPPLAPVPPGLLRRFFPAARAAAAAIHDTPPDDPEVTAHILASVAADHYGLGVQELRQALVDESGLDPVLSDHLATLAILALEARHGGSASDPR